MQTLKNIIFDFGGVLLNLDMNATEKALKPFLGKEYYHDVKDNDFPAIFLDLEVGKISGLEFLAELQSRAKKRITTMDIRDGWNAMLLDFPEERLEMLLQLRKNYRVFLLSNTNEIHIKKVMKDLYRTHGISTTDFEQNYFDKVYYSHLVQLRKPDAAIYEHVLQDANLLAEETLFIDDNPANIEAAHQLGLQTHLHNDGKDILEVMANY